MKKITEYFAVNQERIQPHAGSGHWNDPDMILVGNYGLTIDQSKSQMAIWAILAAPLLMSNDLKNIRPEFREILINRKVIAVNQDKLGIQGKRLKVNGQIEVNMNMIFGKNCSFDTFIEFYGTSHRHGLVQSLQLSMAFIRKPLHGQVNVMMVPHIKLRLD